MKRTIVIDHHELRANPALRDELRANPGEHVERRVVPLAAIEVRAADDGEGWQGIGLAAVFDSLSENLGGFREKIDRGAFRKLLAGGPDVRALINHDPNLVLGRTLAETLALAEVVKGLQYTFDAPGTTYADDLRVLLERGDITQSSFAFRVADDSWDEDPETGALIRTIHEFSALYDVSPVTYPAYPATEAGVRSEVRDALRTGDGEQLRQLAWKLHHGDTNATAEERELLDRALADQSTVSPWVAERALMAVASEPELQAAIPGKRASVDITDAPGQPDQAAATARRLLIASLD